MFRPAPSAATRSRPALSNANCDQFGGSISVLHTETGLFVNFGAGIKNDRLAKPDGCCGAPEQATSRRSGRCRGASRRSSTSYGKTTIYGEYYDYEGGGNSKRTIASATDPLNTTGVAGAQIWSTGVQTYGAGLAQGFDKAAIDVYLSYRHVEGDLVLRNRGHWRAGGLAVEDLDLVLSGAIIKF